MPKGIYKRKIGVNCGKAVRDYKKMVAWNKGRICSQLSREKNGNWKGGIMMHGKGYILIKYSEHPFCNNHGYVSLHRLIMEKYLGRYLKSNELVHHINNNIRDNRIENLKLTTRKEHCKIHLKKYDGLKCSFSGCNRQAQVKNLCSKHYLRKWKLAKTGRQ